MIHGTHYMARSSDVFPDGKTWGPWLWYLNDGSKDDVSSRATEEFKAWPYKWFQDAAYRSRGSIEGKLILSDGRPAAGAAVFLGDNNSNLSSLDQGANYYYITYADNDGKFLIRDVRTGTYGIEAWSNGGKIGDVSTTFKKNDVIINDNSKTKLKSMTWSIPDKKNRIFQVGDFDRKTIGFKLSGPTPFEHGRISHCPANLTYMVGQSQYADWCFGQSALGTHSIVFSVSSIPTAATKAKLTVSLAGFSSGSNANILLNEAKIGNITGSSVLLPSSQDTYRGATQAGEWHLLEFLVPKNQVKVGQNRFDFRVTSSTMWRGWLWDSVVFEWV
jgi:rhamnogalacturonan endolyase